MKEVKKSWIGIVAVMVMCLGLSVTAFSATQTEIADDFDRTDLGSDWTVVSGDANILDNVSFDAPHLRLGAASSGEAVVQHVDDIALIDGTNYLAVTDFWKFEGLTTDFVACDMLGTGADAGQSIRMAFVSLGTPTADKANIALTVTGGFTASGNPETILLGGGTPVEVAGANVEKPDGFKWVYDATANTITAYRLPGDLDSLLGAGLRGLSGEEILIGSISTASSLNGKLLQPQFSCDSQFNVQFREFSVGPASSGISDWMIY